MAWRGGMPVSRGRDTVRAGHGARRRERRGGGAPGRTDGGMALAMGAGFPHPAQEAT